MKPGNFWCYALLGKNISKELEENTNPMEVP